jgi:hypothetical protein
MPKACVADWFIATWWILAFALGVSAPWIWMQPAAMAQLTIPLKII